MIDILSTEQKKSVTPIKIYNKLLTFCAQVMICPISQQKLMLWILIRRALTGCLYVFEEKLKKNIIWNLICKSYLHFDYKNYHCIYCCFFFCFCFFISMYLQFVVFFFVFLFCFFVFFFVVFCCCFFHDQSIYMKKSEYLLFFFFQKKKTCL